MFVCYLISSVMIFISFLFFSLKIKNKINGYKYLTLTEKKEINIKGLCYNMGILFFICGVIWGLSGYSEIFKNNFLIGSILLWICICILNIIIINKFKLYKNK